MGYMVEFKYIKYKVQGTIIKQGIKMAVGLAGLLAIRTYVIVLCGNTIQRFFPVWIDGLWMTVAAPILFRFIFKDSKAEKAPTMQA